MNQPESMSNFEFLTEIDPLFFQLAKNAELTFVSDPNTSLIKVRQLGEAIAQYIVDAYRLAKPERATQLDLINLMEHDVGVGRSMTMLFHTVRTLGNVANHEFKTSHRDALNGLCAAHGIAIWFTDQIEASIKTAQARVNLLTQSILAKAFRGELTAKWREEHPDLISGENSAEALLARIQAEKTSKNNR